MEAVGIHVVPVTCRRIVTQRVLVGMGSDAGIAGGAGCEQHQHGIVTAGGVLRAVEVGAESLHFHIEIVPAVLLAAHQYLDHTGEFLCCLLRLGGNVAVCGADDGLHTGGLIAVGEIVLHQLIGGRDGDGADLVERQHAEPELVMPLQDQHNGVALPDTQGFEIVGGLGGVFLHIAEGEAAVGAVVCHPQHSQLVGGFFGDGVHAVEGEVELVIVLEGDATEHTRLVVGGFDEVIRNGGAAAFRHGGLRRNEGSLGIFLADLTVLGVEHHSVEFASALADGDHTVGDQAVVEDGVTLVEDVHVTAHLYLQRALDDDVKLLTVVGIQLDGSVLLLRQIGEFDEERLRQLFLEFGGQVVVDHALFADDLQALALSRDGKGGQSGAGTFQQIHHLDAAGLGAFVNKSEAEVGFAHLQDLVILHGHARQLGQLLGGKALRFPQVLDSACHFFQIVIHCLTPFVSDLPGGDTI